MAWQGSRSAPWRPRPDGRSARCRRPSPPRTHWSPRCSPASAKAAPLPKQPPPGEPTLVEWLTELFLLTQPLDDARRTSSAKASAFSDLAITDPPIGAAIAASDAEIAGLLASLVQRSQLMGETSRSVDPDTVAWAFLALAQGSASRLLYAPHASGLVSTRARAMITAMLPAAE